MRASKPTSRKQRGFSLIELLVGVVVGLLAVLVITQVMALAEGKRRTVSMGGDAQINGALAMFTLQRDIQQSGYGAVAMPDAIGCTVNYKNSAGTGSFTLAPVVITSGGAANVSDSVTILQGNTVNFSAPILLSGVAAQTDDHFTVKSSFGAVAGDMMILVPQGWTTPPTTTVPCGLFSVTSAASPATATLTSTNVPHGASSGWNQSSVFPSANVAAGSYLMDMGTMTSRTYSISASGNLQGADLSMTDGSTTTADLYPQIVMMQALYGKDANGDGTVDTYDKTTPVTNADWQKVKSIRVALVARSNQYEKEAVTTTAPLWDIGTAITVSISGYTTVTCNTTSNCLTLDVSKLVGTDWQHYRYKVYDTIVPLRNVLWNS